MAEFKVEFLPAAKDDLNEIFDYILLENPVAAEEIMEKITNSLDHLRRFPHAGVKLTQISLEYFQFRMVIVKPYIAFYRFIDDKVLIYRVLHEARGAVPILKTEY